jgi:hypothetical protein
VGIKGWCGSHANGQRSGGNAQRYIFAVFYQKNRFKLYIAQGWGNQKGFPLPTVAFARRPFRNKGAQKLSIFYEFDDDFGFNQKV